MTFLWRHPNTMAEHNFSRVSSRDALAFGSARPGFPDKKVTLEKVHSWIEYMKCKGVQRVLSLLGDDEINDFYPGFHIDDIMSQAFGEGMYTRTSVFASSARAIISSALATAKTSGETIVMHCSGGEGRAALAMGLWLVDTYGLAPPDACREVDEEATRNEGVARRINAAKLTHLIEQGSMSGFVK